MSLAENLLNSLDETAYQNSRIAGIQPEEEHIVVGRDRTITVPNSLKTIAVKGDKDIETVTFDCVRYWDGHDLSTFAIYINYILPNGDEGTYIPENITKLDDIFTFDWEIGSEITYASGKLIFWIVAKFTDDEANLTKQWSSLQNSDCTIAQGGDKIYVPEVQTDKDVISQAIAVSRDGAERAEKAAGEVEGIVESAEASAERAEEAAERAEAVMGFSTETWTFTLEDGRSVKKRICIIKPTFNVDFHDDIRTYQFEDGMTWGEWLDSTYNDGAFYWDAENSCIRPSGDDRDGIWTPNFADIVQLSDKIVAKTKYVLDAVM